MTTPGNRLRRARKIAGLTAAQLGEQAAKLLNRPRPISESAIRNQENGTNGIPAPVAEAYAKILETTPNYLLFGMGDPPSAKDAEGEFHQIFGTLEELEVPIAGTASGRWVEQVAGATGRESIFVEVPGLDEDATLDAYEVIDDTLSPNFPRGSYLIVMDIAEADIRDGMVLLVSRRADVVLTSVRRLAVTAEGCDLVGIGARPAPPVPLIDSAGGKRRRAEIALRGQVVGALVVMPLTTGRKAQIPLDLQREPDR